MNIMTILEAIQSILSDYPDGLICKDITSKILERKMYSFKAKDPNSIVNHELRKHCEGLTFPAAHPLKYFTIVPGTNSRGKSRYQLIEYKKATTIDKKGNVPSAKSDLLPAEKMQEYYDSHSKNIKNQLLDKILNSPPAFFENLVVDLLLKIGYGYNADSGTVVGKPYDGGIDGIINEDALGLDKIYIQAKRYSPSRTVGYNDITAFGGAMLKGIKKGVFITTSSFTKQARNYVLEQNEKNISLIDGEMLVASKTSLTDVPFAVTEAELLAELGWNLWDIGRDVNEGFFRKA